ncbi:hypothetical protein N9064_00595 [bacterium]|nr:hypothetical protein [bacterium]
MTGKELKEGYYWVRWSDVTEWEPAEWVGWEFRIGDCSYGCGAFFQIGPHIPKPAE